MDADFLLIFESKIGASMGMELLQGLTDDLRRQLKYLKPTTEHI